MPELLGFAADRKSGELPTDTLFQLLDGRL
jgi:hypothetical protein